MSDVTYTQRGVMAQIWVAFGQGSGTTRASQSAVMALETRYFGRINDEVLQGWGTEAVQVLERIRTIGRLAALNATQRGDTAISEEDVTAAISSVERESDTSWCPPA